jgi:regulation of enolase protein 1 (concanavalin A-like superfamily)
MNHTEKTNLLQAYYGFDRESAEQCARTVKNEHIQQIQSKLNHAKTLKNSKIITA